MIKFNRDNTFQACIYYYGYIHRCMKDGYNSSALERMMQTKRTEFWSSAISSIKTKIHKNAHIHTQLCFCSLKWK